jgi:hypothetical protein
MNMVVIRFFITTISQSDASDPVRSSAWSLSVLLLSKDWGATECQQYR